MTALAARRTLDALMRTAPLAVVILDSEARVRLWSTTAALLFGFHGDNLEGRPFPVPGEIPDRIRETLNGACQWAAPVTITRPNGDTAMLEMYTSVMMEGDHTGVLAMFTDVTARHRARAALEASNRDLEQFAYVASHDLQEPLRMVKSYLELLVRRYEPRLDGDAREFIRYAVDGAERMQKLVRGLLDYSRVQTRGQAPAPVSAEAALCAALSNLDLAVREAGAEVAHEPLPVVAADETQLEQLFQNLLSNALKFRGPEPPRITVSSQRKGKWWEFAVRDTGIGMDPALAGRAFQIFQRLNPRRYPGDGVGLAICKRIVERHGGRIWVDSEPGHGATFRFTLPAGVTHADA